MKKLVLVIAVLVVVATAAFALSYAADEKGGQQYCGSSETVAFKLKNGTNFLIPKAYLFDPSNMYYRGSKDPIDFINIQISKKDGSPNCKKGDSDEYIEVAIKSYDYETLFSTAKEMYPYSFDDAEKDFQLYRRINSINKNDLKGEKEFLLPKNSLHKDNMFLECSISGFAATAGQRLGCTVRGKIDGGIIEYVYNHSQLENYAEINNQIKNKVQEFRAK